jgi:hypothetical protein
MKPDKCKTDCSFRLRAPRCSECGRLEFETWALKERKGQLYCERCLLNTPEKLAYEKWFVEPHS